MKLLMLLGLVALSAADDSPWELSGGDQDRTCKDEAAFTSMWGIFDTNHDGTVTHLEFDTAYTRFDFDNKDQEDLFFLELDRVPDEALTSADFQHIFKLFDIDASGCVDHREWQRVWKSLTDN